MSERKFGLGRNGNEFRQGDSLFSFSAYDMALMYNCKLFKSSINKLCNCSFDHIDIIKRVLRNYISDSFILDYIIFNCDDDFFQTCIRGSYFGFKDRDGKIHSDKIFFGFSPELICRDIVYKKNPVENYLYGVSVTCDVVDLQRLKDDDVDFCQDDCGWLYFPVDNISLESDDLAALYYDANNLPAGSSSSGLGVGMKKSCVAASFDLERNLDICHSLITLHKMEVLIASAGPKIVDMLNNEKLGVKFVLGRSYNYVYPDSVKRIYCGDFIHMVGMAESIYFGLSPNVFDEEDEITEEAGVLKTRNPRNIIVSDYFSSVSMVIMNCNGAGMASFGAGADLGARNEKYINNGVEFAGNWVYFPVCRKLLCCNNFEDLYIKRIVKLVRESFIKYFA